MESIASIIAISKREVCKVIFRNARVEIKLIIERKEGNRVRLGTHSSIVVANCWVSHLVSKKNISDKKEKKKIIIHGFGGRENRDFCRPNKKGNKLQHVWYHRDEWGSRGAQLFRHRRYTSLGYLFV
jgi:hypothetical protein